MAEQKGKYQPWSHEEFMADRRVRRMSSVALKTYMMLLHEAFVCEARPNLPDNEEELELMAYCTDHEEWLSVRDTVLGMFRKETIDGVNVLVNKRLNRDWENLQQIRESLSERGKSGAAKRWGSRAIAEPSNAIADDGMEVSKEVSKEREEKEESIFDPSLSENDGQEDGMKIKNEIQAVCAGFGVKPGGFKSTWDDVKALGVGHSVGAVVRDFTSWLNENRGDDFPSGAVPKYLRVAHERLSADSQTSAEINDPEVASLARQITRASGGEIAFLDKQKVRLSAALKEFTLEEILAGFKEWFSKQDVAKDGPFLAGKYAQQAADLAYNVREDRLDREHAQVARDAKAVQMREEAEADRQKAEAERVEAESFDPLADLA